MGLNESLCLNQQDKPTYKWCRYQAIDDYTIIVQIAFMVSLLMLSIIVFKYYTTLRNNHRRKKLKLLFEQDTTFQIFAMIIPWLIISILKVTINLVIYQIYMSKDFQSQFSITQQQEDRHPSDPIVVFSVIFSVLDYLCPCLLLLLIFTVPYKWLKATLMNTSEKKQIRFEIRKKIHFFFKVLQVCKLQNKIVLLIFPLWLICEPILLFFTKIGCGLPRYNSYFVYTQSIFVLLFYIFGFYVFVFMKKQQLLRLPSQHQKRIKIEYFLLMSVLIVRMCLNYYFKLSKFYHYQPNINCTDRVNKVKATIFLSIAVFIMHQLPIIAIVCIYKPSNQIDQNLQYSTIIKKRRSLKATMSMDSMLTNTITQDSSSASLSRKESLRQGIIQ